MAKSDYPKSVDGNIIMVEPYQYGVQIRKIGYKIATETFETLDDAIKHRDNILSNIRRGEHKSTAEAKHITLGELLERYSNEVAPIISKKN